MAEKTKTDKSDVYESDAYESDDGSQLAIADRFWDSIRKRDRTALVNMTFFEAMANDQDRLQFQFLTTLKCIDLSKQVLLEKVNHHWVEIDDPLLTLATTVYLNNIRGVYPMGQDIVGVRDLKEGHFFMGPHELRVQSICSRYGKDLKGFKRTAEALNGHPVDMADAAYRLLPFPRVPLYYLLWQGDDEFGPRVKVLFDRSIENTFPADAIWGLVNRVTMAFETDG